MNACSRHIIVTKQWPVATGGGLGVARQFYLGLSELDPASLDVWAVCGNEVIPIRDAEACLRMAGTPKSPPQSRLSATWAQAGLIRQLATPGSTIIAFTPFYAWLLARRPFSRTRFVHVEQSKGGRHHELASFHGRFGWREELLRFAVALNFYTSDVAVFPSVSAIELFAKKNPELARAVKRKAIVIHNGTEPLPKPNRSRDPSIFRILSICEDVPEKNLADIVAVARSLRDAGYQIHLHHFGKTRDQIRASANDLPVTFHGLQPRERVLESMSTADAFLHLPIVAIFDLALIEAMSSGLPVVATPVGGNLEALGRDYPFFADSPESATGTIRKLIENPAWAGQIASELSLRADTNFSSAKMATKYLDL